MRVLSLPVSTWETFWSFLKPSSQKSVNQMHSLSLFDYPFNLQERWFCSAWVNVSLPLPPFPLKWVGSQRVSWEIEVLRAPTPPFPFSFFSLHTRAGRASLWKDYTECKIPAREWGSWNSSNHEPAPVLQRQAHSFPLLILYPSATQNSKWQQ